MNTESDQKAETTDWLAAPGNKGRRGNCRSPLLSLYHPFFRVRSEVRARVNVASVCADETGLFSRPSVLLMGRREAGSQDLYRSAALMAAFTMSTAERSSLQSGN